MKTQIEHKGKIFKYMMICRGYLLYGYGSLRILVNEPDRIVDEYNLVKGESC